MGDIQSEDQEVGAQLPETLTAQEKDVHAEVGDQSEADGKEGACDNQP